MPAPLHLPRAGTVLALIDVQEKLVPTLDAAAYERASRNCHRLLQGCAAMGVPVVVTEQYPKGLGPTVASLRAALPENTTPIPKLDFSCATVDAFAAALQHHGARHVVLAGMETHICILQSASGLREQGFDVWVAQDACVSRTDDNWRAGLRLCEQVGATVAPTESILFWLLGKSGTPEFKRVSQLIK